MHLHWKKCFISYFWIKESIVWVRWNGAPGPSNDHLILQTQHSVRKLEWVLFCSENHFSSHDRRQLPGVRLVSMQYSFSFLSCAFLYTIIQTDLQRNIESQTCHLMVLCFLTVAQQILQFVVKTWCPALAYNRMSENQTLKSLRTTLTKYYLGWTLLRCPKSRRKTMHIQIQNWDGTKKIWDKLHT